MVLECVKDSHLWCRVAGCLGFTATLLRAQMCLFSPTYVQGEAPEHSEADRHVRLQEQDVPGDGAVSETGHYILLAVL